MGWRWAKAAHGFGGGDMKAVHLLAAMPLAAAVAGLLYLISVPARALRRVASAWCLLSLPASALLAYRFWDRHVGPQAFALWRLELTPDRMAFVIPLAVLSPFLVMASRGGGAERKGKKDEAASALACFAVAAILTAALSDHLFLLAAMFALATWCLMAAVVLRGNAAGRVLPYLLPLALSDLCLALGVLFYYLADPSRGLLLPPAPLGAEGGYAVAMALMLAAAFLRLGLFPAHRWMPGLSRGGRDILLVHLLAVDMTAGAFLLFALARLIFSWGGAWTWACLGIAALSAAEVSRELLLAREGEEVMGLLCSSLGAGLALAAAAGGQAALAAMRVGLWAGLTAVGLVEVGRQTLGERGWLKAMGGASLLGMPPLAGFAWLGLAFSALGGAFTGGISALFIACLPLLLLQSWVMGAASLLVPRGGERAGGEAWLGAFGLAAACLGVGLFPGAMVDLLMREYGMPVEIPLAGWTSLGVAMLLLVAPAALILGLWARRGQTAEVRGLYARGRALPLLSCRRLTFPAVPFMGRARLALACANLVVYAAWAAAMVYLALR